MSEAIVTNFKGDLMKTKYKLKDIAYTLYDGKIYRVVIESITKTEVIKNDFGKPISGIEEQETYGLRLIKTGNKLTRTNNVNSLFSSPEEVLNNIEIIE